MYQPRKVSGQMLGVSISQCFYDCSIGFGSCSDDVICFVWHDINLIGVVSFIGGGNRNTWRKPPTCRKSLTSFITYCCIEYTSPWAVFELTTLVVISTDSIGSCKCNYHAMTTTTAPSRDMSRYETAKAVSVISLISSSME